MPTLSSRTRLGWVDDLRVHLFDDRVNYSAGDCTVSIEPSCSVLLDLFRKPATFAEAADLLNRRVADRAAWVEATSGIVKLHAVGLLVDANVPCHGSPDSSRLEKGYEIPSLVMHARMLHDRRRTESFLSAVREVVRPGDIVVDVGAGTGVLAIAAAQAGAARVYAVERTSIINFAKLNIRQNGLQDRVTPVAGWSMDVELPERADVLVSEIIGNDPFDEKVVEVTADARMRLLKPDARMVPQTITIFALPLTVPDRILRRCWFTPEVLENWRSWYGIDFSALARSAAPWSLTCNPGILGGSALADPVPVATADLRSAQSSAIAADRCFTATASGRLNGVMICFEAELSRSIRLSTHPDQGNSHWKHRVWMLPEPLTAVSGSRYLLTYRHGVPGQPDGVHVRRAPHPG